MDENLSQIGSYHNLWQSRLWALVCLMESDLLREGRICTHYESATEEYIRRESNL